MKTKETRWVDFAAIFFLIAVQWCAVSRLVVTEWSDNLTNVRFLSMLGLALGGLFGYSQFKSRTSFWLIFLYSIISIPWQIQLNLPQDIKLTERLLNIWGRLYFSFVDFVNNKPVNDPILFIVFMAILFWITSVLNGYHLVRYAKPWVSLGITGIIVFVIEYYAISESIDSLYLFLFIFFSLLLVGRVYHIQLYKKWKKQRVKPDSEFGFHLGRTIAIGGFLLVLVAWNFPGIIRSFSEVGSVRNALSTSWDTIRDRLSNAFTALGNRPHLVAYVYGDEMKLGYSSSLGDSVIFRAEVESLLPSDESQAGPYYWQARSYDYYQDGEWSTTRIGKKIIDANEKPFSYPQWSGREIVDLTFYPVQPLEGTIYSPAYPITVSRPINAVIRSYPDDTNDVIGLMADPPIRAGESYNLTTFVSAPTAKQLLEAGEAYPEWISEIYLQLPANLPQRMIKLAETLAEGKETPFEKALAVTNFLRAEITYQESIDLPPPNKEPLDWFLFDYKAGFCNYYASSEVILLRIMGIPARLAVGYAEGSSNQDRTDFIVLEKDSHAWPEVFFPGIGWVEFEPTSSQPLFEFPEELAPDAFSGYNPTPGGTPTLEPIPTPENYLLREGMERKPILNIVNLAWFFGILAATIIIIGIPAYWYQRQRKIYNIKSVPILLVENIKSRGQKPPIWLSRWSNYARLKPIERQFTVIKRILTIYGKKPESELTPAEQVGLLVSLVPQVSQPANALLHAYDTIMYSPDPVDIEGTNKIVWIIQGIVLREWVLKLIAPKEKVDPKPGYFRKR